MRATLMANKTEWSPEEDYTTEVRVWEDGYIFTVTETEGEEKGSRVEVWMSREQLEAHIATLQAGLVLPQINHARVSSESIKAKAEAQEVKA